MINDYTAISAFSAWEVAYGKIGMLLPLEFENL